jgi:CP family cyanate transporter-like MFS transporter
MNVHKTCGIWFPQRQLGMANGVVAMGMALGFMLTSMISATALSPLLGGWRNVLFFYGIISVLFSGFWHFTRVPKDKNDSEADGPIKTPLIDRLKHMVRIKNIWLLGLMILGIGGCVQGMLGYLPLYLRNVGWSGPMADNALGTFHGISMICTIPIAMFSDRLGFRKKVLMIAAIMLIAGTGMLSLANGFMVWIAVIIGGMVRDGFMAIYITMVIETRGVGAAYAGMGIGLTSLFSAMSNLISPPFGNSLAQFSPGLPFVFWALLGLIGFTSLCFVAEN